MKSLFGKYWALYLAGAMVLGFVVITVLVQLLWLTNAARWLFSYIFKWSVALVVFRFIIDWAESLSVAAAITIVIAAFVDIRYIRRRRASARVKKWAKDAVAELTCSGREISAANRIDDWKRRIIPIRTESSNVLTDARACGNGLELKVDRAVKTLMEFEYYLDNRKEFADINTSLKITVGALTEVMN